MYEQAEPVRTPQAGSDREQKNRPRAPYLDPPARRGNTSGHVGCNVKMYEQAEPVSSPQAGSGREQNVGPRAPYQDPPGRRGNTSGHVNRGKHASHEFQRQDTSLNLYEEVESVKLKNISGDAAYETVAWCPLLSHPTNGFVSTCNSYGDGHRLVQGTYKMAAANSATDLLSGRASGSPLRQSYEDARKACIDDGGTLAMPKTRELDVALRNLIKTGQN
ncbi:hypothetical protein Bbelb_394600 [Branchiostoma belcheri]|nr:hypothetical protein Bbelb_394600 [Branchiostoma belcheri]